MKTFRNLTLLAASLAMLAACCECQHTGTSKPTPKRYGTRAAAAKPEVATPASHNACVNSFKLTPGTEQYTKCINSLSTLEAK